MKMIFGFVGILIVLAIVASLAKTQLKLFSGGAESATRVMDANSDVDAAAKAALDSAARGGRLDTFPGAVPSERLNVQQQSTDIQNQVRDRVNQNLQKGVERSDSAQP